MPGATMPEMDLCSAACAIQNLWLAARAELGMGWVSIYDPAGPHVGVARGCPLPGRAVSGPCGQFYPEPMLETLGWDRRRPLADLVFQDTWGQAVPTPCA